MITKVSNDLNLKEKELQAFEVTDTMHPQNLLKGFISLKPDHRYGAVAITHINDQEAYQIIFATPKQHYPFGRDGSYCFPKAKEIEVYEKFDGTNVLAYQYKFLNQVFQTYKLRLFPVLRNSKWGNFLDQWNEMLEKYPALTSICEKNGCSVSFELYGNRNTHLIVYDTPLEIALLFGVDAEGHVITPSKLNHLGLPVAPLLAKITSGQELVHQYNRFREEIEKNNSTNPDETIKGSEGVVWYLLDEKDHTSQFKCKPESVETIHWSTGAIDVNTIKATAHNVLETEDTITYEATVQLLLEEFTEEQITISEARIHKVVEELREWYAFQKKVLEIYKTIGIRFHEDKNMVMRTMSSHFPKTYMKRVGFILKEYG